MKTKVISKKEAEASRAWRLIDAEDKVVGRLATEIASILRGKDKPHFSPNNDDGDFVVVVNADKVKFTGSKFAQKNYFHHTGYVGGIKKISASELIEKKPTKVLEKAVKGMLPSGPLGRKQLKKLKIYSGEEHPHNAQLN